MLLLVTTAGEGNRTPISTTIIAIANNEAGDGAAKGVEGVEAAAEAVDGGGAGGALHEEFDDDVLIVHFYGFRFLLFSFLC